MNEGLSENFSLMGENRGESQKEVPIV